MTTTLDDYKREEIALRRAARALRWGAREPGQPAPDRAIQAVAREVALFHLREARR